MTVDDIFVVAISQLICNVRFVSICFKIVTNSIYHLLASIAVGINTSTIRSSVSSWAIQEQSRLWQALPKSSQAKLFLNTSDKGLARFALSLEKKDLRILVGLLTGHADLNRHFKIMGLQNEAVCPLCQDEEETSIHFIVQCSATMLLRRSILDDYTLSLDTLNGIHWAVLLRFVKASRRFL